MLALRPLAILTLLSVLGGCSSQSGNSNNSTVTATNEQANSNRSVEPGMEGAKDNVEELRAFINLPYDPEDLVWRQSAVGKAGDPRTARVLAVFQLTPVDSKKLIDNASKIRPGAAVSLQTEKWFPKELVTQNEMSNDEGVPAISYPADEFLLPPYSEGSISQIRDSDFFVLEVFAR